MSRYKRVVLDESSDGGDNSDSDDCNGVSDNDNDASVSDNSSALSGNESYLFDGNENKKNSLVYKNVVRNFDASNSARFSFFFFDLLTNLILNLTVLFILQFC